MQAIHALIRIIVGALFVFSGAVKAIDPIGTKIKMEEYFSVFAGDKEFFGFIAPYFELFQPYALAIAIFIVVAEVVLGVALILNFKTKLTLWAVFLMILFFTALTFYSWKFDKVTDCGCFGDAIKLTPAGTLIKDIILTVLTGFLLLTNQRLNHYRNHFSGAVAGIVLGALLATSFLCYYAIANLPPIDFRAYKVGNNIKELREPKGQPIFKYIMEKDGELHEFDEYPKDKSYTFKDMVTVNADDIKPTIEGYNIWNDEGEITEESLEGKQFMLVIHDVKSAHKKEQLYADLNALINALKTKAPDLNMFVLTSDSAYENFRHEVQLPLPYYYSDATELKAMIRANPGIIVLQDGVVKGKFHYNNLPTAEAVLQLF
ncbi:MAG: DoxX family protein [Bernardetiaceae bacterium]|nr:DoxX family protein [Bernardetiaceae bacterium]